MNGLREPSCVAGMALPSWCLPHARGGPPEGERLAVRFARKLNPAEQRLARRKRQIGDDARKLLALQRLY
jgi:hypothetical protein